MSDNHHTISHSRSIQHQHSSVGVTALLECPCLLDKAYVGKHQKAMATVCWTSCPFFVKNCNPKCFCLRIMLSTPPACAHRWGQANQPQTVQNPLWQSPSGGGRGKPSRCQTSPSHLIWRCHQVSQTAASCQLQATSPAAAAAAKPA